MKEFISISGRLCAIYEWAAEHTSAARLKITAALSHFAADKNTKNSGVAVIKKAAALVTPMHPSLLATEALVWIWPTHWQKQSGSNPRLSV